MATNHIPKACFAILQVLGSCGLVCHSQRLLRQINLQIWWCRLRSTSIISEVSEDNILPGFVPFSCWTDNSPGSLSFGKWSLGRVLWQVRLDMVYQSLSLPIAAL